MSPRSTTIPALLAFVAPDQNVWGVALGAGEALIGRLTEAPATVPLELTIGPWVQPVARAGDQLELVRVSGRVTLADHTEIELNALGVRYGGDTVERLDSARLLFTCFPDEQAVALFAMRPQGGRGQERDQLSVASAGERDGVSVFDPRLSSTYGPDGELRRVGVELWLGETEEGDQHPHRVAGEAAGSDGRLSGDGLSARACAVRCHSRGEDGTGVYVLIRPA